MADEHVKPNVFGKVATTVDHFFETRYYKIGLFVGSWPLTSCGLSVLWLVLCVVGFSQFNSESRSDKLWIPQGTRAQSDEAIYTTHWPVTNRFTRILLEAKSGSALDSGFLDEAIKLHDGIEKLSFEGNKLADLCVPRQGDGHPCFIQSVLGSWNYNRTELSKDADPLATLNAQSRSKADFERMLGGATFNGDTLTGAKVLNMMYFLQLNRELSGGRYKDVKGEGWEEKLLEYLKCDSPVCEDDTCACGYSSPKFVVYAQATRSFSDAFGSVIQGDVGLINGAFMIMIVYLILNLGGLCHKVKSRALLAFGCVLSIVASGAAGYGLSMWFQFDYTPVHSVLPFVIIGIGVDDSFVIMNAFDRTDKTLPVNKRIASALSHAGVSIMVTSLTDFVAFAISVSSALPALSAFCMYAAFSVLMLFVFQVTMFTALATLDARRQAANRIDCCFCMPKGCPCCPTVTPQDAEAAVKEGEKDPNQMLCCREPQHQGGLIGRVLERGLAPQLVKLPVGLTVVFVFVAFTAICAWQASELAVEDTQRKFIPDDSYALGTISKTDEYFGNKGVGINVMTLGGNYFAAQEHLASIGTRLGKLDSVSPITSDSFSSWAESFKDACASGALNGVVTKHTGGVVDDESQYYAGVKHWLDTSGKEYARDVVWVNAEDPQKGIAATQFAAELKSVMKEVGGRTLPDAGHAIKAMDEVRSACDSWTDMPGGKAVAFSREFLTWETFRIIKEEMFLNLVLCLVAVLFITLALIAHPLTSLLVFICVLMTIVDILGCMNMWGLAIDNVSVIQLVISVGLSVDYSAHVGHNFMTQVGTNSERVVKTLGDVGAAVLCGGTSTFLGVMLLALSQSYVFRVLFQTFFLTVVLGLLHGMVLLPVVLNLVGPASFKVVDQATKVEDWEPKASDINPTEAAGKQTGG